MIKKLVSTTDEFFVSLNQAEKSHFDEELRNFALSEMVLAAFARDATSAYKLAQLAGVSPAILKAIEMGSQEEFYLNMKKNRISSRMNNLIVDKTKRPHRK